MADASDCWVVPKSRNLNWRSWNGDDETDEFVVFNPASGETHFLNLTAAIILRFLEERPATTSELTLRIREGLPLDVDASALDQIPELLQKFDEVGLIARVLP